MTTEITLRAHAKINVFLRVLGVRDDGYHDIESLVLPISLHDLVTVRASETLSVAVTGERAAALQGAADENLALVAARRLAEAAGVAEPSAEIEIDKRIPVAAGLGGGSADAAAALRALNELWGCGLEDSTLTRIGADIGADVPALLADHAVSVAGRGEHIEPVKVSPTTWVFAPMRFGVRTPDAYDWWDAEGTTGPNPRDLIAAAERGDVELLGGALFDDLQGPVSLRHPEIGDAIDAFTRAGALGAVMTGSGPTVVALARDLADAERLVGVAADATVVTAPASVWGHVDAG